MYEQNRLYVWRRITDPGFEHLSGVETTVIGPGIPMSEQGKMTMIWPTDTPAPDRPSSLLFARPGDLRPRDTPSGERKVQQLFEDAEYLAYIGTHMDQVDAGGWRVPIERPIR